MAEVKHEVTYLSDVDGILTVPSTPTKGNLPVFGDKTDLGTSVSDSGKSISDFVTQDNIGDAVKSASADILAEISGAYAIKAYSADQWSANTNYPAGGFCQHGGVGYRCKEEHESGTEFDASKWEAVLTSEGKSAIDAMLFGYSKDGLVGMSDVASSFDSDAQYVVGQLVAKDGTLQVCTKPGRGGAGAEFDSGAAVEKAISARVSDLVHQSTIVAEFSKEESYVKGQVCSYGGKFYECTADSDKIDFSLGNWEEKKFIDLLPAKTSAFENDSGFAYVVDLVAAFDSSKDYKEGDVCTYGGKFYVCVKDVSLHIPSSSSTFEDHWEERKLHDLPKVASSLINDINYISAGEIVPQYDTSTKGYEVGELCSYGDGIYVCNSSVSQYESWSYDKWTHATLWDQIPSQSGGEAVLPDDVVYGDAVVPEYDNSKAYSEGDVCSYKGKFYKCVSKVQEGSQWNSGTFGPWREMPYHQLPRNLSTFVNDSHFVTSSQIAKVYDTSSSGYAVGDVCSYDGIIWQCTDAVDKGSPWDSNHWEETDVASLPSGSTSWDDIDGAPDLSDVARAGDVVPAFGSSDGGYSVGDACSHEGKFYRCVAGTSSSKTWNAANWEEVTYDELRRKISSFENDAEFVSASQIAGEYDSRKDYSVGDVCSYKGGIYVCDSDTSGAWNAMDWTTTTVADIKSSSALSMAQSDWEESDSGSEAFIKNKPEDLVHGDFVAKEYSASKEYVKGDVCSHNGKFYRCTYVKVSGPWTEDAWNEQELYDIVRDMAYSQVSEIERALDDIIASNSGGQGESIGMYTASGIYMTDEEGKYHKITLVTDPETGEVNIGVSQE